jgi:glycine hydroxymethyltransferase
VRGQADALVSELLSMVNKHEEWRAKQTINLNPAENVASPVVRSLLATDLGNRYTAPDRFYQGTRYLDEVEALGVEVAKRVFEVKYADLRPLSGHVAAMIVIMSLLRPGEKFCAVGPEDGGYPGYSHLGLPRLTGHRPLYFPYDRERMTIDAPRAVSLIQDQRPALCIFGASFIPFSQPVSEIAGSSRVPCVYDGSHVLGLIAGGQFQRPLAEGCGVLYGSTHKSFWGPQGGIILADSEPMFTKIHSSIHPALVDNAHWNRIAALTYALIESLHFGSAYARQVVRNSRALAKALHELGVPVKGADYGFTQSHQVIIDRRGPEVARWPKMLEDADIIVDNGIRLGTSEVTRLGMGEGEMEEIANIFSDVVMEKVEAPQARKRVRKLRSEFQRIRYTFEGP